MIWKSPVCTDDEYKFILTCKFLSNYSDQVLPDLLIFFRLSLKWGKIKKTCDYDVFGFCCFREEFGIFPQKLNSHLNSTGVMDFKIFSVNSSKI